MRKRAWRQKTYYVYIVASQSRTLYVGVTCNICRRLWQHQTGVFTGFTSRYKINQLVYLESYESILEALAREKQVKGWSRRKKIVLIERDNPDWLDLSTSWEPYM